MIIEERNYIQLSFPIPKTVHKGLKCIASSQGKSIKSLLLDFCVNDLFQRPENKEIVNKLQSQRPAAAR